MHDSFPVPRLMTLSSGPLRPLEEVILSQVSVIEAWFREEWRKTPPPFTSSVDLRHGGFKLAPVDTNLFPAGFNNLNRDLMPLCVQAVQAELMRYLPGCKHILIVPESHTRNPFYLQSLAILRDIFMQGGFVVRIGSLDPDLQTALELPVEEAEPLLIEPLVREGDVLCVGGVQADIVVLNNDLSTGIPPILAHLQQDIVPTQKLGWSSRLKSNHFHFYQEVACAFSQLIGLDPWFFDPMFVAVDNVDFMAQQGIEALAQAVDNLLTKIHNKYQSLGIHQTPFVAVKADSGTYGMGVMMVREGAELLRLNRKQRTRMAATKGSRKVTRFLIQEGVYSVERMPDQAVAEPVVYMIGAFVVGGFYRVHQGRGEDQNLNAPGMHFEPLAFAKACNVPRKNVSCHAAFNRFYVYGVIARLAALAAAREIAAQEDLV